MPRDHYIAPTLTELASTTVRFGAGNAANQRFSYTEVGKAVRLVGESRYDLCAVGTDIEGFVTAVELAVQNGFSIGSVANAPGTRVSVTFDGLQGTPGTGVLAIGDIVNAGTITAKDTALAPYPKVCKATTPANVVFKWRVVSLGTAGTGAVGTTGVIERI
jgi:hypothetical protein